MFFLDKQNNKEKTLLTFDVSNSLMEESQCFTAVLRCVDFRVCESDHLFMSCFLNSLGEVSTFDTYSWPGSQKDVFDCVSFRNRFLELFEKVSIKHHGVKRLVVLMHWDCAGYGGLQDEETFKAELARAKTFLEDQFPRIEIVLAYSKAISDNTLRYVVLNYFMEERKNDFHASQTGKS